MKTMKLANCFLSAIWFFGVAVIINCGADFSERRLNNVPLVELTLLQINDHMKSLPPDEQTQFLYQFEGFRVRWSGKVVKVLQPQDSDQSFIQVEIQDVPGSLISLVVSGYEHSVSNIGKEINFEGVVFSMDYDGSYVISLDPTRIIDFNSIE